MKRVRVVAGRRTQAGLTLVELLVTLTVGLVVTLIALSMLVLGRSGYTAVDAGTQLVDKERFAADIISRVISQAGFEDYSLPIVSTRSLAGALGQDPEPDIFGWNNALYADPASLAISSSTQIVDGNRSTGCTVTDTSCRNGSDVLMVRFQGSSAQGMTAADMSMINCRGEGELSLAGADLNTRAISFFHVQRDDVTGEPSLACTTYTRPNGPFVTRSLLAGVESLQVLYGTDNVVPATVPAAEGDSITDRWLRADQLKVPGNEVATRENFRRVRAVRIGLVLRGTPGSAQERVTASLAPLGSPTFVTGDDVGSRLDVAADGRLRRVVNFTAHVRNELALR